ncbi:cation-transporting P-type ATPase [Gramella sp. KN1008]|uniref:cation-translocating P-type ATPase n=1 Tax=Gramella sp. KN1008 TaxID=2529298 RepID=UPI00103AD016|nr:cation-transporting P-type ATPase [Gramella sp. KN1008]TBW29276.1 cation-transporting P-type ATPase [Gramella sp. KN1008]
MESKISIKNPHAQIAVKLLQELDSDKDKGLSSDKVRARQAIYGPNLLERKKKKSVLHIFAEQFLDPIIYILAVAMVLAFFFQDWIEGFAVLFVIIMTSLIGFFMELQAVRSIEALQKLAPATCRVLRDSEVQTIESGLLVPGDILILEMGDMVPADARLIETNSLAIKESVLTGESHQIEKIIEVLDESIPLSEQKNMVFSSTVVTRGSAKAIVTATGNATKIGEISKLTHEAIKVRTPLEKKLNKLSRKLIWLTLILAVLTTVSGYIQGKELVLMIKTGIALAVAAIPEGLPIVATIALARGMLRLSKEKVVIKRLESVETLGEVGVICTDKTGTLTENKMLVENIVVHNEHLRNLKVENENLPIAQSLRDRLIQVAALCNNSRPDEKKSGDPIEEALLHFAIDQGGELDSLRQEFPRIKEFPFDTEKKRMLTVHNANDEFLICVKGAMETLLDHSSYLQAGEEIVELHNKDLWLKEGEQMASGGLRTLALAYKLEKEVPSNPMHDLILLGLIGFQDPPRKDVADAIETYRKAGVKVVMVTGDHPNTARKIGEEIKLVGSDSNPDDIVFGKEFTNLKELTPQAEKKFLKARIFARMIPEQKLDLVELYQNNNLVVGMLGDGVNDTPALKKADIGIAMGIRGTEAAKEVADVILMDDKFTSTELAIRQGRNIFENIRHFVVFLLSCNLAEIIAVALASLSSLPLPLTPLQILFLNLVTDVFPALALGMGKGSEKVMQKPPRLSDEPIITRALWRAIVIYSLSITLVVIGITWYAYYLKSYDMVIVNNMAFYTLILGQLLNVFNLPSVKSSFIFNEVTRNKWVWGAIVLSILIVVIAYWIPFLNTMLSLKALNIQQLLTVVVFGSISVPLSQLIKRLGILSED